MPRLARPSTELRPEYDVVVVGSGYGGGVAASRLSRMGLRVAVLERGREYLPGDFPADMLAAQRELQLSGEIAGRPYRVGNSTALIDVRVGDDVHVVQGCGLGGTSLINANVCLPPDVSVLDDTIWPEPVRTDHSLMLGYGRARAMLRPEPLPVTARPLKLANLERSAAALGTEVQRVPLHIAFEARRNAAGVVQAACTQCGDCMSGCNVGAKTTVHGTYLADAVTFGAELFTEAAVRSVDRRPDGRWRVLLAEAAPTAGKIVPLRAVVARIVVLAAGTLGTTEILLRSAERGLAVSDRLGKRVSTNADAIAFGWDNALPVNAIGVGHPPRAKVPPPGPAVAGMIDLRRRQRPSEQMIIVDAAIQSAVAPLLATALGLASLPGEQGDERTLAEALAATGRLAAALAGGAYKGPVHRTQVYLAIGQDGSGGEIALARDRAMLRWPGAANAPTYQAIATALGQAVAANGGTYVPSPASRHLLGGNLTTVHPLGGCCMGADRASGVVDHKGRVFDAGAGGAADAVHAGLFVVDGSVIPRSLGVHPLLTITAIAERAMYHLARDRDLILDVAPRADPPRRDFRPGAETAAPRLRSGFASALRSGPPIT